jgi:hypothetical protein
LLKYFANYQRRNAVPPNSLRSIGEAIGVSAMQVSRLRRRAIDDGLIVFEGDGRVSVRSVAEVTDGHWCHSVPIVRRSADGKLEKVDPLRRVVLDRHLFPAGRPSGLVAIADPVLRKSENRLRVAPGSTLIVSVAKNVSKLARNKWHLLETRDGPKLLQVRYAKGLITEGAALNGTAPLRLKPRQVSRAFEVRYVINDPNPEAG